MENLIGLIEEHIAQPDRHHHGNWYVVTAGTRVGVFKRYPEVQRYTSGVSRAAYQSLQSHSEAVAMYGDFKHRGLVEVLPE